MTKNNIVKSVVLTSFSLFFLKLLIVGVTLESSIVIAILATLMAYLEFKSDHNNYGILKKETEVLLKAIEENKKELEDLRSHVSTVKLAQQVKTFNKY